MDREFGQIDEITQRGSLVVLSSINGTNASTGSITGLNGLSVTDNALWFTAINGLYEASLTGRHVRRVGNASSAIDLDVLQDGSIIYTTTSAIYERSTSGVTARIAGGGYSPSLRAPRLFVRANIGNRALPSPDPTPPI